MSIHVKWDNAEKTVIQYYFTDFWTWEEFQTALNQAQLLMDSVPHVVDAIVNFQDSDFVPAGAFAQLRYIAADTAPNFRKSVIVGANRFILSLFALFCKMYGEPENGYRFVMTMREARALLTDTVYNQR